MQSALVPLLAAYTVNRPSGFFLAVALASEFGLESAFVGVACAWPYSIKIGTRAAGV